MEEKEEIWGERESKGGHIRICIVDGRKGGGGGDRKEGWKEDKTAGT